MFEIIEPLQEVQAKSIADITDAMFKPNINPMLRLRSVDAVRDGSAKEKIEEAIELAHQSHAHLLAAKGACTDHRGNLQEASDCLGAAILYMQGNLRDIERGIK